MNEKEAVATQTVSFEGLDDPADAVNYGESMVRYKLSRLCALSEISNPVIEIRWTCTGVATQSSTKEIE